MKTIIILEDSRKVGFGGGQKGSIDVINALHKNFNCVATDSVSDSIFAKEAEKILGKKVIKLYSLATKNMNKASFSIGILELFTYPFFILLNAIILYRNLQKNKLSKQNAILYSPIKKTLACAYILNLLTGMPFIYHARNVDNNESPFFKMLIKILNKASAVICVSRTVRENLKLRNAILLNNSVYLHDSVYIYDSVNYRKIDKNVVVAAFASLMEWKGLKYLMEAHKHLKNKDRVFIRIYGTGAQEKYLKTLESENVALCGFAENTEHIMKNEIDIICVPSIDREAFGRVPVEGYCFGIPAIVTNIGAQAEITINGKTGIHVPIKNAKAIAEAIDYLLDNPHIYEQMSRNSLEYVKQFDMKIFNEKICEIMGAI